MGARLPATPAETVSSAIRFLILSDTHDIAFPNPYMLPPVDVVLHCGDLTRRGGSAHYAAAIEQLSECKAEIVLVIPGDHDVDLDAPWWRANMDDFDDPDEPFNSHDLFADASRSDIHLLPEGPARVTLRDGRSFTIYTSPYTPEVPGFAFSYRRDEDRFSQVPIPKNVDIVMTHGPPGLFQDGYRLETLQDGYRLDTTFGVPCGCPMLWKAIRHTRPRLHCFGHIHEGYGVQNVRWDGNEFTLNNEIPRGRDGTLVLDRGKKETVLLNAAIMNHFRHYDNSPWVVEMRFGSMSR